MCIYIYIYMYTYTYHVAEVRSPWNNAVPFEGFEEAVPRGRGRGGASKTEPTSRSVWEIPYQGKSLIKGNPL